MEFTRWWEPDSLACDAAPPITGTELSTHYDGAAGLIRVVCTGVPSIARFDTHFAELRRFADRMRADVGQVRVLVDRRQAAAETPEASERLRIGTQAAFRPGDRVAVIVGTSFAKMQLRGVIAEQTHAMFVSETAAIRWLRAYG